MPKRTKGQRSRMLSDIAYGRVYLVQEVVTEANRLNLVVPGRVQHFLLGRTEKSDRFHLIADRASRRTSSAGRAEMFPLLYS